jgi:hypothetical protein
VARPRKAAPKGTRLKALDGEPVRLSDLDVDLGVDTVAEPLYERRAHAPSSAPSTGKTREKSTEPINLSRTGWMEMFASLAPLHELAEAIDSELAERPRPGRPREFDTVGALLYEVAAWSEHSVRRVDRELRDPGNWERIRDAVARAHPNRPQWHLKHTAPSRSQYLRFRDRHLLAWLPEIAERLSDVFVDVAHHIGLLDPAAGSLTRPATTQVVAGDGTWIPAPTKLLPGETYVDTTTGEVRLRRADPDARRYHDSTRSPGRSWTDLLVRNEHPHERVVLSFVPTTDGGTDGGTAVDEFLALADRLPGARAFVYDMALSAADQERLLPHALPVWKVKRLKDDRLNSRNLGVHELRRVDGGREEMPVYAVDGAACLVVSVGGEQWLVPMRRVQTKRPMRSKDKHAGRTVYNLYEVPENVAVPARLRRASVMVRINSTSDELDRGQLRSTCLRVIPEIDESFDALFGVRQDTESLHHNLKERLWGGRARTFGLDRQRLNMLGYQVLVASTALLAWHLRTGGDIGRFVGEYRPPGHTARSLRAA